MNSIRIYPSSSPETVAAFLGKHGFNLGPLTREGFFVTNLDETYGSITTRAALERIAATFKVSPEFEFRLEDIPPAID